MRYPLPDIDTNDVGWTCYGVPDRRANEDLNILLLPVFGGVAKKFL